MPSFTVKANSSSNFDFPARYLIIDYTTQGKTLTLRGKSDNHDVDLQVRGGGKVSGLIETVSDWVFKNENSIDVEVSIQGGEVFYDENRIDGDVNALTRFDNLTKDGNRYFRGFVQAALGGNHSYLGIHNPLGSGISTYVNALRLSGAGSEMVFTIATDAQRLAGGILGSTGFFKNKSLNSAAGKTDLILGYKNSQVGTEIAKLPTDSGGNPTSLNLGNSPIEIKEGFALLIYPNAFNVKNSTYAEVFEE